MDAILAIDIGTSSGRAALYEVQTGKPAANGFASHHHAPNTEGGSGATLNADDLVAASLGCVEQVLNQCPQYKIIGVGVSTFWHSVVGVNDKGEAQTPILLWLDRRSSPFVFRLRDVLDRDVVQRTGCPLHTSYLPGRLWWLAETQKDQFDKSVRFVSPGEYLFATLFGLECVTCTTSMASATGLFDQNKGVWDETVLSKLPGMSPDRLSPISDAPVTGLLSPYRDRFPRLADIPWFPALGDGACSNLGCGAVNSKRIAMMIGTSGALRVLTQIPPGQGLPPVPPGLWRYLADKNRCLIGGALSNGGNVWSWLGDTVRLPEGGDDAAENALAKMEPDAHGLTVLPFLNGERAPLWRDDVESVVAGIHVTTTPLHIARAYLESVAYRFAAIRERLRDVAGDAEIIGTGSGLVSSPVWAQIIADVLGEPISVSGEKQASSLGAALKAREALGLGGELWERVNVMARYKPNPQNTARYREARARHESLLIRMIGG